MKKILILNLGDTSKDPRPRRFVGLFKEMGWAVSLVSQAPRDNLDYDELFLLDRDQNLGRRILLGIGRRVISIGRHGLRSQRRRDGINDLGYGLNRMDGCLRTRRYDLIWVEDLFLLPLAFRIRGQARVVFDAREYYPAQNDESLFWRLTEKPERIRLCEAYLRRCDLVLTVSPGLAARYRTEFGIEPLLFRSVPNQQSEISKRRVEVPIRLVHHGVANRNRNLNSMIEILSRLGNNYSLDMYLTGNSKEIKYLTKLARRTDNVRVLPPVSFSDIVPTIGQYDIGLCYIPDLTVNLRYGLPNKFFEYITGSIAVAVGPSPDMRALVERYQCGVVSEEFSSESMVGALRQLTPASIERFKRNAHAAAGELNFRSESTQLVAIINAWTTPNESGLDVDCEKNQ